MERAQRLELIALLLQTAIIDSHYKTELPSGAAGHAQGKIGEISAEKMRSWVAEIDEIMRVWPMIGLGVQQGLLAIVRAQRSHPTELCVKETTL